MHTVKVRVTAKSDYALRALAELAEAAASEDSVFVTADAIAEHQDIPLRFLLNILSELRTGRLVLSRRGTEGGYALARPASKITAADVVRVVEGPLADVRGVPPELLEYNEPAAALREVWLATRVALREVLEAVTIADIVAGALPRSVSKRLDAPGALERR